MNCHLTHGKTNKQRRFEEIKIIYNTYLNNSLPRTVQNHDVKFLFGDLNFRVEMEDEAVYQLVMLKNYKTLLNNDQLLTQSRYFSYLPRLREAPIKFIPTYKYAKNTSSYELTKKPPAWCDRILWGDKDPVICQEYNSVDSLSCSDHKPVYGIYSVTIQELVEVKSVSASKKEEEKVQPVVEAKCENRIVNVPKTNEESNDVTDKIEKQKQAEKELKEIMQFY